MKEKVWMNFKWVRTQLKYTPLKKKLHSDLVANHELAEKKIHEEIERNRKK